MEDRMCGEGYVSQKSEITFIYIIWLWEKVGRVNRLSIDLTSQRTRKRRNKRKTRGGGELPKKKWKSHFISSWGNGNAGIVKSAPCGDGTGSVATFGMCIRTVWWITEYFRCLFISRLNGTKSESQNLRALLEIQIRARSSGRSAAS